MVEADFNTEVVNSFGDAGAWAYKIADMPYVPGLRFNPDKPCDIIAGYEGIFIGVEGKMVKKFEAFGLNNFRDSQVMFLDDMVKKGNQAYCFLNVRIVAVKGETKHVNRLLILPWEEWGPKLKEASIKKKELEAMAMNGIAGAKGRFELFPFLISVKEKHEKKRIEATFE